VALDPLATVLDLELRVGRELDDDERARAEVLLDDASAAVRGYTGQQFTRSDSLVRLTPKDGRVRLSQRPVVVVASVNDVDGNALPFTLVGDRVTLSSTITSWERNGVYVGPVDVTYTHGYEEIPGDVVAVVCQIAGRAFGTKSEDAGFTGETVQGYSYTVGGAAAAGPLGMLEDEKRVLDRYRRRGGAIRMGP
jgi:hypothetical protein